MMVSKYDFCPFQAMKRAQLNELLSTLTVNFMVWARWYLITSVLININ